MEKIFSLIDSSKNGALKKKIIQSLILSGNTSIADLAKEMELSIPTVTKLVSELLEDGYLLDIGKQNTNGGRKPNMYGLNPESGYFIGVDVQRKKLMLATIDFCGNIIDHEEVFYELENKPAALDVLCDTINMYIDNLSVPRDKILQVGVNIGGRVNTQSGYSYSYFYFDERPLSQIIGERIGVSVSIENDSRAMIYGEYISGVIHGEKNILFVNMNWGLGLGIMIDGKLYYGKSGFSGEFGHVSAFDNEIICWCGKKGCLETEVSGYAIHRMLLERIRQGSSSVLENKVKEDGDISLADIVEAIRMEDVLTIEIVEEVGMLLGRWLAGLINLFNPDLVILGGPLSLAQDYLRLPVKSAMKKYSLNLVNQDTELKISQLGERAGLIGACMLTRSRVLDLV